MVEELFRETKDRSRGWRFLEKYGREVTVEVDKGEIARCIESGMAWLAGVQERAFAPEAGP